MKRKGQGVVESVFSVGILGLLLGGAVVLIVLGIGNRRNSFDRRRAAELANMAIEELISQSKNDPESFWKLDGTSGLKEEAFLGYTYSIGFTNITGNASYPQCGVGKTDCAEVVVKVDWLGKNPQSLYFNRFFSKYD